MTEMDVEPLILLFNNVNVISMILTSSSTMTVLMLHQVYTRAEHKCLTHLLLTLTNMSPLRRTCRNEPIKWKLV